MTLSNITTGFKNRRDKFLVAWRYQSKAADGVEKIEKLFSFDIARCAECEVIIAQNINAEPEKLESHRLWHHPTPEDAFELWRDLDTCWQNLNSMRNAKNWTAVETLCREFIELLTRYRLYAEKGIIRKVH